MLVCLMIVNMRLIGIGLVQVVAWFEEEGLPLNHFLLGRQSHILMIPSYLMLFSLFEKRDLCHCHYLNTCNWTAFLYCFQD